MYQVFLSTTHKYAMINSPQCKFIPNKFRFSLKLQCPFFYDYQICCWNKSLLNVTNLNPIFGIKIFTKMTIVVDACVIHSKLFFCLSKRPKKLRLKTHHQGPPPCICHPHSVVPTQTSFARCLLLDAGSK